jgi:hypothetical protein
MPPPVCSRASEPLFPYETDPRHPDRLRIIPGAVGQDGLPIDCEQSASTRDTASATPTPEDRSSDAARDSGRLHRMTAAETHADFLADRLPADAMHPEGAPRDIALGRVHVDAWEVEGAPYASMHTGDLYFHGTEHQTPYRVLQYQGRTFLINDVQNDSSHHVDMIQRAASHGRTLTITDEVRG